MLQAQVKKILPLLLLSIFISPSQKSIASIQEISMPDGASIRLGHWLSRKSPSPLATIVFLQGRASYIEKFQETITDLTERGYEVWTFDWRGTGGSSRIIKTNSQKCHIDSYETYIQDLKYILHHFIKPKSTSPLILMGVSMGGHLALRYIEENPHEVSGAFLISPMLNIPTDLILTG
jgi:lysophospholipase